MSKGKSVGIFLILVSLIAGGVTMTNGQDKPPLLLVPSGPGYSQVPPPPPPPGGLPPLPPGQRIAPVRPELASNARKAVAAVLKAKPYFAAGKVWTMTAPRGETELKAAVLYDRTVVAVLHFNPVDGSLLPLGAHPRTFVAVPAADVVRKQLPDIMGKLEVLPGAEYQDQENAWVVPLAFERMIVAHLKVSDDGILIVPDYPGDQEMRAYGK